MKNVLYNILYMFVNANKVQIDTLYKLITKQYKTTKEETTEKQQSFNFNI